MGLWGPTGQEEANKSIIIQSLTEQPASLQVLMAVDDLPYKVYPCYPPHQKAKHHGYDFPIRFPYPLLYSNTQRPISLRKQNTFREFPLSYVFLQTSREVVHA